MLGTAAWGQSLNCQPPRLLANLPMRPAGIGSSAFSVPVTLNGSSMQLVLDTGGAITQLSRKTIRELGLPLRQSSGAVYDVDGRVSRQFTVVRDFIFGDLHRANAALFLSPDKAMPFAGEIAQDMLSSYDIDLDFAAATLGMYAKNHCPDVLGADHIAFTRVAMINKGWHLHIMVTLDGHTYDAIFDTGSSHTIMRSFTASRDFALSEQSPDMIPYNGVNGDPFLNGHLHRFSQLSIGDIRIEQPTVLIIPDIMNRNADRSPIARSRSLRHNADLRLPELSLGMDVLRRLHLYIAFGENALYIAPARTGSDPVRTDKP